MSIEKKFKFPGKITSSQKMIELFQSLEKVSHFKTTVLLIGESGTGKELFARSIHNNSNRAGANFIGINCGALPEHLIESELFGHRKGAFTDASRDKKGLFEEASGGTIFLDEIGEIPIHLQAKLLRVLQESTIRPVGSEEDIKIDVRVIAATLRDLEQDAISGRFRDDLLYRINVVSLRIPALRERREDIPELAEYLIKKTSDKLGIKEKKLDLSAIDLLLNHNWPGNIRELENYIERALIISETNSIKAEDLPSKIKKTDSRSSLAFDENLNDNLSIKHNTSLLEEKLIKAALQKTSGNKTHAAKILEISHRTLLYKIKEYGLEDQGELEAE